MDGYETIALRLASGQGYTMDGLAPTAQREPLYPLLISVCYLGGRRPWLVLALQCLLSLGAACCAWRLARRLGGERAGLAALAVAVLHPQLIYYSGFFARDLLLAFLLGGLALASADWAAAEDEGRGERGAALGGWAGAGLALCNTAHLPAVVLSGAALGAVAPKGARARRLALFWAPVLLGCAAWGARNHAAFGRLVPGSTHGGEEFYQALVVPPEDLGTPRQTEILAADAPYQEAARLPEAERSAALTKLGLSWIGAHPGTYLGRAAAGVVKFWRPWPYKRAYAHSYAALVLASLVSDAWLIPLFLWWLWRRRASWREAPAVWTGALGLTALYGAVHAVIRYRLPLVPVMAAVAGLILAGERRADA